MKKVLLSVIITVCVMTGIGYGVIMNVCQNYEETIADMTELYEDSEAEIAELEQEKGIDKRLVDNINDLKENMRKEVKSDILSICMQSLKKFKYNFVRSFIYYISNLIINIVVIFVLIVSFLNTYFSFFSFCFWYNHFHIY